MPEGNAKAKTLPPAFRGRVAAALPLACAQIIADLRGKHLWRLYPHLPMSSPVPVSNILFDRRGVARSGRLIGHPAQLRQEP